MKSLVFVFAAVLAGPLALAQGIFEGNSGYALNLSNTMPDLKAGDIVIIGENHGLKTHQAQQLEIMNEIRKRGLKVSVGLEFFYFPDQPLVNQWIAGTLSEADFLAQIKWGSPSFSYYRDQAQFPASSEGSSTLALNAPRSLTSKVAKAGLESLDGDDLSMLPPNFELGRDSYKKRFLDLMPHIPSVEAGERYFAAQSIWDDTMAYNAVRFIRNFPDQVLVIVVGDFHVQYGGGLPDRIRIRGIPGKVWTWSQLNSMGLEEEEIQDEMAVSAEEGPRADYVWVEEAQP